MAHVSNQAHRATTTLYIIFKFALALAFHDARPTPKTVHYRSIVRPEVATTVAMVTVTRAQDNTISYTGLCGPAACCQSQENEYVRLQDMMVVLVRQVALLQHALGADPDFHWDLSGGCSVTSRQQSPCGDMCTSKTIYGNVGLRSGQASGVLQTIPGPDGRHCAVSLSASLKQSVDLGDFRATCVSHHGLCSQKGLTVSVWLKIPKTGSARGFSVYATGNQYSYIPTNKFVLTVYLKHRDLAWRVDTSDIPDNTWFHLAFTWTRALGVRVYVNGNLVGQGFGKPTGFSQNHGNTNLVLGRSNQREQFHATAAFSNLKIFTRELTASHVALLHEEINAIGV
ncbi:hypothetical protein Bbelb_179660 [Branchiostoma belcheri]|nr:hypothetical protein Bbelb_179660 [Branchiostoma belcheri]